jgi:uncharacterized SAM-binding protein YcdF (DUF218 family)
VFKILILTLILIILITLGVGLINLVKGKSQNSITLFKSLKLRIILSAVLFLIVIFSAYMGWIEPNKVNL